MGGFEEDPKLDPICELFRRGDPEFRSLSFLSRVWLPSGGVFLGCTAHALHNLFNRRPIRSGVQRYVALSLIGLIAGEWMWKKKLEVVAERDLQYYHYMTLHPEDFPPPRRVLYRDYLEPWNPVR